MRVRNVAHTEGNWATLVYVTLDNVYLTQFISQCMKLHQDQGLFSMDDHHISLSRTLYLKTHQIPTFIDALKQKIQLESFQISFSDLATYVNDEKTCNFLALNVHYGKSNLLKLVTLVNAVNTSLGLAKYYDDPKFHTSFAWSQENINIHENVNYGDIHHITIDVSTIHVRCGNRIYEINL